MRPGDVVFSKAGRDGGRYFAVVAVESEKFVRIADGDVRRLKDAKRKSKARAAAKRKTKKASLA